MKPRGYTILAVMMSITICAVWVAAVSAPLGPERHLERERERAATATRLAELGLQRCQQGRVSGWVELKGVGRYRAERTPQGCVGHGAVPAVRAWPELTRTVRGR